MNKKTLKEAGYKYISYNKNTGIHTLENEDGKKELFIARKNHASWGIRYKNTHLEFIATQ